MSVTYVKDIEEGSVITFRSKNPNDDVLWRGTLEMRGGTYRAIQPYMDPRSYNEAVRQIDPSVPSDVTQLSYFLITVDNDASVPTTQAFAQEWIQAGSLNVLNLGNKVTLVVEDPGNNVQTILSILANAGYSSKVIS